MLVMITIFSYFSSFPIHGKIAEHIFINAYWEHPHSYTYCRQQKIRWISLKKWTRAKEKKNEGTSLDRILLNLTYWK